MAEKKEYVGVISERNRTRVIQVEKGSNTHKLAEQAEGDGYFRGWKLANPSQVKKAAEEKKSVKNAGGKDGKEETTQDQGSENPLGGGGEAQEGTQGEQGTQSEEKVGEEVPNAPARALDGSSASPN